MKTYKRPKKKRTGKRYRAWVKMADMTIHTYVVNDLLSFTRFLDEKRPGWRFFNVYSYVPIAQGGKGNLIASYTKNKRPKNKLPSVLD